MRITIPQVVEVFGQNATNFDVFNHLQLQLMIIARDLQAKYPNTILSDIDNCEASLILKTVKSLLTMGFLCAAQEDYDSCAAICRGIADKICSLKLVYANQDETERKYRHYLYALDGLKARCGMLVETIKKDSYISQEEFEALSKQMDDAHENANEAIQFFSNELENHPYAKTFPKFHKSVVGKGAWRYRKLGELNKGKHSEYRWNELYRLLDSRESIVSMYSCYLSQFVHGLSLSTFMDNNDVDNFESLISVGITLQGFVLSELRSRFGYDSTSFGKLLSEEEKTELIGFFSPQYIESLVNKANAEFLHKKAQDEE